MPETLPFPIFGEEVRDVPNITGEQKPVIFIPATDWMMFLDCMIFVCYK